MYDKEAVIDQIIINAKPLGLNLTNKIAEKMLSNYLAGDDNGNLVKKAVENNRQFNKTATAELKSIKFAPTKEGHSITATWDNDRNQIVNLKKLNVDSVIASLFELATSLREEQRKGYI